MVGNERLVGRSDTESRLTQRLLESAALLTQEPRKLWGYYIALQLFRYGTQGAR